MTTAAITGCSDDGAPGSFDDETYADEDAFELEYRADDALSEGFELALSDAWACGDLLLHVANPDRSIMLTLYWPQMLDETDADWEGDVGGSDGTPVAIVVHTGTRLDAGTCARQGDEPAVIAQTWTAVAEEGHLELAATNVMSPRLSTWLWDMELRREGDGATVIVDQLEQVDVELAG